MLQRGAGDAVVRKQMIRKTKEEAFVCADGRHAGGRSIEDDEDFSVRPDCM